jgi:hypothetical protein
VAGSLKRGWVTASLLIGKLQSYPRKNRLTRALQEYGRLVKTVCRTQHGQGVLILERQQTLHSSSGLDSETVLQRRL